MSKIFKIILFLIFTSFFLFGFSTTEVNAQCLDDCICVTPAGSEASGDCTCGGLDNCSGGSSPSCTLWGPNCGGATPPPSGGSCFPARTGVSLVDGNFKNIEDVKVGDRVWGLNEMGVKTVNTVKRLIQPVSDNMCEITFRDGQSLKVTNSHPLYTGEGWKAISVEAAEKEKESVPVTKLKVGDRMLKVDGTKPEVTEISCWQETVKTYNFTVDNSNTYFAGGFLAHNKAGNAA